MTSSASGALGLKLGAEALEALATGLWGLGLRSFGFRVQVLLCLACEQLGCATRANVPCSLQCNSSSITQFLRQ